MIDKPDNPFNFWEELKRRKVVRVIIGYLASSYIILELISIIAEPFRLPEWTLRFVFILLCIGFVFTVILSWIYDITPKGIMKTESAKVIKLKESIAAPAKRNLRVSDAIIGVLLVAVIILAYPRIFKKDKFRDIRDEDGRISVAVMPFENKTNDTLWNVWQEGIQHGLITGLSNSKELAVCQFSTMSDILQSKKQLDYASFTPLMSREIARRLEANTFIVGNIQEAGGIFRLNAQLVNSETEEIYKSYLIDGNSQDEIFLIIDSLSMLIKNYLEIRGLQQQLQYDELTLSQPATRSPEAYRLFIRGIKVFEQNDYSSAIELFREVLKIDTNFFFAHLYIVYSLGNSGMYEEASLRVQEAHKQIETVPYHARLWMQYQKAIYCDKDPYEATKYLGLILDYEPQSRTNLYIQGYNYISYHQYEKAIIYFEKSLEISEQWDIGGWEWYHIYTLLGRAYHETGQHDKEKDVYELGLRVLPDHPRIVQRQAICAFSLGDTNKGNELVNKYRSIGEEKRWTELHILCDLGITYQESGNFNEADKHFRQVIELEPEYILGLRFLASLYIIDDINLYEGIMLVDRALEIYPGDYYFLEIKGWSLFKSGQLEEALEVLNESWDLRPMYSHTHYLHIQEVKQALAKQKSEQ